MEAPACDDPTVPPQCDPPPPYDPPPETCRTGAGSTGTRAGTLTFAREALEGTAGFPGVRAAFAASAAIAPP